LYACMASATGSKMKGEGIVVGASGTWRGADISGRAVIELIPVISSYVNVGRFSVYVTLFDGIDTNYLRLQTDTVLH
jgi:hypothetical protein